MLIVQLAATNETDDKNLPEVPSLTLLGRWLLFSKSTESGRAPARIFKIIGVFLSIMSQQSLRLSRARSMSRSAKRLRMWGTCACNNQNWWVLTACMRVQRIPPSTGVSARLHTRLLVSNGLTSVLSSNLLNPYTDRRMDVVTHITRPSGSTRLMPREACARLPTLAFFHASSLLFPRDICCSSAFEGHQDISTAELPR